MQRRVSRPRRVGVGPLRQQERGQVLVTAHRRHHQGAVAVGGRVVHVGARRQQDPRRLEVSVAGREQQRREPAGVEPRRPLGAGGAAFARPAELPHRPGPRADGGAVRQQHAGRRGLAVGRRPHQRGLPLHRLDGVDIGAVGQQGPHSPRVAGIGAAHQQRLARPERQVRVGPGRQQPFDAAGMTVRAGRPQGRRAVVVLCVQVRPGPDQAVQRGGLVPVRRPVQRRGAVRLRGVEIGTLGDQGGDLRPRLRLGGGGKRRTGGTGRADAPEQADDTNGRGPRRARTPLPANAEAASRR